MSETKEKEQTQEESVESKVKKLKKKHNVGEVVLITVGEGDEEKVGYFKYPWFTELSMYQASVRESNVLKGGRLLLDACFLDGDRSVVDDDDLILAAIQQLPQLIPQKEVGFEKSEDGGTFKITSEEGKTFSFKKPNFESLGDYLGSVEKDPVMSTFDLLRKNKYEGDDEVINNPFNILAILGHVDELVNVKASKAVKY